ncbi:putative ribose-phosphate diphosphokinase, Peptidylprolyl isomerase [Helianthus anomalus]
MVSHKHLQTTGSEFNFFLIFVLPDMILKWMAVSLWSGLTALKKLIGDKGKLASRDEAAIPANATLQIALEILSWKVVSNVTDDMKVVKKILKEGEGYERPNEGVVVQVKLIGKLQDGTVFIKKGHDDSEPFEFKEDEEQVIDGLDRAVMTMTKGEVALLKVAPEYAFGSTGSEQELAVVPPNATLWVSPDVGGVARARAFAKSVSDAPLAIVDKRRHGHNVMNLIGDVKGKVPVTVDDMIDTAGTIAKGVDMLHREGAGKFTHAARMLFSVDMFYGSPPAIERLSSGLFQEVIITNTILVSEKNYLPQLIVLSVANLLGESIWRVHDDYPVSIVLHLYAFF